MRCGRQHSPKMNKHGRPESFLPRRGSPGLLDSRMDTLPPQSRSAFCPPSTSAWPRALAFAYSPPSSSDWARSRLSRGTQSRKQLAFSERHVKCEEQRAASRNPPPPPHLKVTRPLGRLPAQQSVSSWPGSPGHVQDLTSHFGQFGHLAAIL